MRSSLRICVLALIILTVGSILGQDANREWSYERATGPEHWSELSPAYAACKLGGEQSPIDVRDAKATNLPTIHFDYQSTPLKIIDNGHTIQVNYAPGSSITVGSTRYELKQVHFHHPSENRIQGKPFALEAHLVHADSSGNLAVVAVLLEKGTANAAIREVWAHLPKTKGEEQEVSGVWVNAAALLPSSAGYYTYRGSLTTPPCTEGVTWFVLKTPMAVSPEQIDTFGSIYPNNARPIQPAGRRVVNGSK